MTGRRRPRRILDPDRSSLDVVTDRAVREPGDAVEESEQARIRRGIVETSRRETEEARRWSRR